mmetsp:Transcript_7431/g.17744  ORF Transcript_7431/g.17744 Transcript_7431/m.17744 type:complete len:211 (+) Transcript_7431:519-1151(+)
MAVGEFRGLNHLALIHFTSLHSESDVLSCADGEENRLLGDHGHVSPEVGILQLLHINVVDFHCTSLAVVEPLQQRHAGALSAARLAHQSDDLVGLSLEAHVLEHLGLWASDIVEANIDKLQLALTFRRLQCSFYLDRLAVDDLEDLHCSADGRGEARHDAAKHCHRAGQADRVEHEGDQSSGAHLPCLHQAGAVPQHNGEGDKEEQTDNS